MNLGVSDRVRPLLDAVRTFIRNRVHAADAAFFAEIDENGRSPADAILVASETRLRPILLTTATTILGLIPLWLGGGPMWQPMAIAIIFGLAFATMLTLGVVPVLYSILFRVRFGDFRYGAASQTAGGVQ